MSEVDYLNAVGNRCSIGDNSKCVSCKAVHEAVKYVKELEAENKTYRGICSAIIEYNKHVKAGSDQYYVRGDMFRILEQTLKG